MVGLAKEAENLRDRINALLGLVAIIAGFRLPLIFRPLPREFPRTYRVIRDAYVMGLMCGQAAKSGIKPMSISDLDDDI
jgi:hypothetical protein